MLKRISQHKFYLINDSVDWEVVLHASHVEVAKYIAVRGVNYVVDV
jgi:hypothetical protein